ncbi:MAG: LCP family protein [Streptosporangiaceae bacterium]
MAASSPAHPRYSRRMKVSGAIAIFLTSVLVLGSLAAYVKYRAFWDSIHRVNVSADLTHRPPGFGNALNILLIGSDSRAGKNGLIGGRSAQGQRSDTVMIVHISPSPHHIVVLSIPRDSVVPVYPCAPEDGAAGQQAQPGTVEQINSTFAFGGPGCLWKTIEQTTHIRLDDFIELDFVGFENVINDLGGVNVCLPQSVNDPMSGLKLSEGRHHIWGKQALAFWRTREDLGLGSDLQRIQRDQFLMIAMLHGIEKSDLLASPTRVAKVISDAARAMTTDSGLTLSRMLQIAEGMRGLTGKSAQFIEVPVVAYPQNQNWVEWTPQDNGLFAAIAHNVRVPKMKKSPSGKSAAGTPAVATVSPAKVNVEVLNGSGVAGVAGTASAGLTSRGFNVAGSTNASSFSYTNSVVQYASSAGLAAAKTVQAQVSGATLQMNSALTPGTVDLILGSSFSSLAPNNHHQARSTRVGNLTKTYGGLTGNANVCNDKAAFAS